MIVKKSSKMKSFLVNSGKPIISETNFDGLEPVVKLTEKKDGTGFSLAYTFPGFWFYYEDKNRFNIRNQDVLFTQIKIPKAGFINEIDKPLLPSFGRYVQIPAGYTFDPDDPVTIIEKSPTPLSAMKGETEGTIHIKRSEYELSDEWSRACDDTDYEEDYFEDFFQESEGYPANDEIVNVAGPFAIDGYTALLVHVRPFRYVNPKSADLVFYDSIKFDINLMKDPDAKSRPDNPDCQTGAYGNLFLNPERDTETPVKTDCDDTELLIIYKNPNFLGSIERLRQWKEKKGLKTDIVSVGTIGKVATADGIKRYIRSRRDADLSKLRYVILFGDVDEIPPEDGVNSDYYYTTPKDPDGFEPVFPWLACGRIPVKSPAEADIVVKQIIQYEENPDQEDSYYKEMTFCAYMEDSAYYWQKRRGKTDGRDSSNYVKTMEDIRDHLVNNHGFAIERVYEQEKGSKINKYCNGADIPAHVRSKIVGSDSAKYRVIAAARRGQLIIGHRGHGSASKWRFPEFHPAELIRQARAEGPPPIVPPSIFFSVNCLTGKYNRDKDCLAEVLLKFDGAAPSLIAPSRSSNTWLNNSMMKAFFDSMWPGILKSFHAGANKALKHSRLGDILNYGKTYLPIAQSNLGAKMKRHFEIYHVLGDPSLELWKRKPKKVGGSAVIDEEYLFITFPESICPEGCIATVCSGNGADFKVHIRIRLAKPPKPIALKEIFPGSVPQTGFSVCFSAPGCLVDEVAVESSITAK